MFAPVLSFLQQLESFTPPENRRRLLLPIASWFQHSHRNGHLPALNFICTHNSRRSHFSQIWCQVLADYYGIPLRTFSAGTEATAVNPQVIETMRRVGFQVKAGTGANPV